MGDNSNKVVHLFGNSCGTGPADAPGLEAKLQEVLDDHARNHAIPLVSVLGIFDIMRAKLLKDTGVLDDEY